MHVPSDRDPRWSQERASAPDPWDLDQLALRAPPPPEHWHVPGDVREEVIAHRAADWAWAWAEAMLAERARRAKEAQHGA